MCQHRQRTCSGSCLSAFLLAFLASAVCLSAAGQSAPKRGSGPPFSTENIAAFREPAAAPVSAASNSDCFLVVLVGAVGIDHSTPETFLKTMARHPRGSKREHSVGHAWLILGGPLTWVECGHTGEFALESADCSDTIHAALKRNEPNPLGCLWKDWNNGSCELGSGGHKPTAAVHFELTPSQYQAIRSFLENYDFKSFSVRERVCTDFVTGAAALGGIKLGHRVTLDVPRQTRFKGRTVTWWTDPKYSLLSFGSPDVLEKSLKLALEKGLGKNVLDQYGK